MNIYPLSQESESLKELSGKPLQQILPGASPGKDSKGAQMNVVLQRDGDRLVYDRRGDIRMPENSPGEGRLPEEESGVEKDGEELSNEETQEISDLKKRDLHVRAHEQAHMAAGGDLVRGGAHYEYKRGPDGNSYAVSGEVSIDISEERSPEQTVQKMQRVQAAAMAPADPSPQDRAVAAAAAQKAQAARASMTEEMKAEVSIYMTPEEKGNDAVHRKQLQSHYDKGTASHNKKSSFHIVV